jgi:hypothetical protein
MHDKNRIMYNRNRVMHDKIYACIYSIIMNDFSKLCVMVNCHFEHLCRVGEIGVFLNF